ncbi:D-glycero-beta-D-manno-heptose-1,7-bisphosphate 7-phosphatase [Candidatus Erwinia haradaeae]|uniref:D,D-heptose 1,7-bisphosphate phosphatase n=1 Tax=Candidatus Erwinia haradaeae TaxID=1922217 RepID=A0A803GCB1_9GAMM|nr:D-glycero-beta-D-manno-heptose-1,7-bisphosphate 7-phosphatase [Candidatus Erwinia haradaeae]
MNLNQVPAIFFDRDGTINIDHGYISGTEHFEFIDGAIEAMHELITMGFILVLITNQSGIGRGIFSQDQFIQLTRWMSSFLERNHIHLAGVYFCPHHPHALIKQLRKSCDCRKPKPGMFFAAQKKLHINMLHSYMVGDKIEDMQAAKSAGVGTKVLLRSTNLINITKDKMIADWILNGLRDLPSRIKQTKKSI